MVELEKMLRKAVEVQASDVFLKVDSPPAFRLHGQVHRLEHPPLTPEDMKEVAAALMTENQMVSFEQKHEMDLGFSIGGLARFRVNVYQQRGSIGIVMRVIDLSIKSIEELGLPPVLKKIAQTPIGLVLVTGPTGCGKSTTLAAMLDQINADRRANIITVEDPVEYVYTDRKSVVSQREVGIDTGSFQDALRAVVREAPDVILIGEMRDVETFDVCLKAAETGHLVFSTVHTSSAAETLNRIINMFPPHDKEQICQRLSKSLVSTLSQKLIPRKDGQGRACAVEVMIVTPTIAQYVEEGRSGEIYSAIVQDGIDGHWGMQSMNQALDRYYKSGVITEEMAMRYAGARTELRQMLRRTADTGRAGVQPEAAAPAKPAPPGAAQ